MAKIYTSDNFIVIGGTSSQFLKGDGTLDSSTYLTSLSGAVLTTGDQSISGYKTFTAGTTVFSGSGIARLEFASSNVYVGDLSVGDFYYQFSNSNIYGYLFKNPSFDSILSLENSGYATFINTVEATAFKLTGGTSSQFLKGDGTVDTSTYLTSASLSSYLLISTAASTYYPIPTGTISQYIRGNGTLATFPTIPTVTPAAMTKVDDTNVTLTLGGTPSTSLLQATSLTLGWTGTLADARISSAATWNSKQAGSTNLTSLSGLSFVSTSFVKMTAAGTFQLDINSYYLASNPSGFTSNVGTVTSVSALTIGTTGTDLTSTVTNSTSNAVITLNVPTASATNRGALSAADWAVFNGKQGAITPAAMTKVDDTNVTLTLGGAPTTSLLQGVSLTLGWTGTLADARIASSSIWNAKQAALSGTGFVKSSAGVISYDTSTYLTTSAASTTYAPISGSGNYIQNQNASAQSANMWISGAGTFGGDISLKNRVTIGATGGAATAGAGFWTDFILAGKTSLSALTSGNGYGIFYYQGSAGRDGNDSIDFAFNTTTSATSVMSVKTNGDVKISGELYVGGKTIGDGGGGIASNSAFGFETLLSNVSGVSNTAIGYQALRANTNSYNTAVGYGAMAANLGGSQNAALGYFAMNVNSTGNYNMALGVSALRLNSSGSNNMAIGYSALYNSTGTGNCAIGSNAFGNLTSGGTNIAIGLDAGRLNAGGLALASADLTLCLGPYSRPLLAGQTNQIMIGYLCNGLGSNTTAIGNSSTITTAIFGNLLLGTTVDDTVNKLQVTGSAKISSLAGTGTRTVVADANGKLSTTTPALPYKVYTALISQSGTVAPVATVLENTLGGTVVWGYTSAGLYTATLSGIFTTSKTAVFCTKDIQSPTGTAGVTIRGSWTSTSTVSVSVVSSNGGIDGQIANSTIEIRVYN